MGLLDDTTFYTIFHVISLIIELCNLFWIYTVWRYSTQMMAKFKIFLMKMATSDLIFSLTISWLFQPNVMLPLPCATVYGPLKYLGSSGGQVALILAVLTGLSTLISVNDCCISRFMIIYGHEHTLHHFSGFRGLIFFFILYGSSGCIITFIIVNYSCSYKVMKAYAERYGKGEMFQAVEEHHALIAFDADDPRVIAPGIFIGGALIFIESLNIFLSAAVQHKLNQTRKTISNRTYKMQRSFTYFLIVQATVPFLSIATPVIFYCLGFLLHWTDFVESGTTQGFAIFLILMYPLINCICCFALIKPYKIFLLRLLSKVIKPLAPKLAKVEPTSTIIVSVA